MTISLAVSVDCIKSCGVLWNLGRAGVAGVNMTASHVLMFVIELFSRYCKYAVFFFTWCPDPVVAETDVKYNKNTVYNCRVLFRLISYFIKSKRGNNK